MSLLRPRRSAAPEAESRSVVLPYVASGGNYADVNVTASTVTSLQKVAVWAVVDLVCSLVSELPVDVYRGRGPGSEQVEPPAWLADPDGSGYGVEDWIAQFLRSMLLRGNAVGVALAHVRSMPTAIVWQHPDEVQGWDRDGRAVFAVNGREIPPERLVHKRAHVVAGEAFGLSPVQHLATTLGLGIALTRFGRQWFVDGAHPSGMLVNDQVELSPTRTSEAKAAFKAALYGSRDPVVLGKGWSYKQVQINPEESQFLETNQFTSAECARIFGPGLAEILGYETGGSLTYSNREARSRDLLVYAVGRWIRRTERVLSMMVPRGQYVRLNRDALLETTTLERYRVHEIALRSRIRTPNEVRALEDEPPVAWGDEPLPIAGAADDDEDNTEPENGAEGQQA